MKKVYYCCCYLALLAFTGLSCRSRENTRYTRFHHAFRSKYNIYYNAKVSFDESLSLLVQQEAGSTTGNDSIIREGFIYTIDKCKKAIDTYSIRKKPPRKPGWRKKPKQVVMQQKTEYNPFLIHCWLLSGKAQFFRQEYNEALLTFDHLLRIYKEGKPVAEARLWRNLCYLYLDHPLKDDSTLFPDGKMTKEYDLALSVYKKTQTSLAVHEIEDVSIAIIPYIAGFNFHPPDMDSDLIRKRREMMQQDVYQRAYECYLAGDFRRVRYEWTLFRELHAGSGWEIPFLFIYALTWVAAGDTENYKRSMEQLLSYGESAFSSLAETSLSLIEKGAEVYPDHITPFRRSLSRHTPVMIIDKEKSVNSFSAEPSLPHYLLLLYPPDSLNENELLFKVAGFNFTNLLITYLDLRFEEIGSYRFLLIKNFRNLSEADDYMKMITCENGYMYNPEEELSTLLISESNYKEIKKSGNIEKYLEWVTK